MSKLTMDECPTCRADLGRQAFEAGMFAGDVIECAECHDRFLLSEHTDGWQNWYSFERIEERAKPWPRNDTLIHERKPK